MWLQKRNRSPQLKDQKFQEIIQVGKSDLLKKDIITKSNGISFNQAKNLAYSGFNMENIARNCQMTRGNLYRYIESKRELWFAILQDYVKLYSEGVEKILSIPNITNFDRIIRFFKHYINFCSQESHLMQKMIFLNPPPPKLVKGQPEIGSIEREYLVMGDVLPQIKAVVDAAIDEETFIPMKSSYFFQYLWGTLQGSILVIEDFEKANVSYEEKKGFQEYVIEQIEFKLNTYTSEYREKMGTIN